jgi:hypothetical protein
MTSDASNLRQYWREYFGIHLRKCMLWRGKNLGDKICHALAAKTARERFKGVLSEEELEALNAYLSEETPEEKEHLSGLKVVSREDAWIREVELKPALI